MSEESGLQRKTSLPGMPKVGKPPLVFHAASNDVGNDLDIALEERAAALPRRSRWLRTRPRIGPRCVTPPPRFRRLESINEAAAAQSEFRHARQLQEAALSEEEKTKILERMGVDFYPRGHWAHNVLWAHDLQWAGSNKAILPDTGLRVWIQNHPSIHDANDPRCSIYNSSGYPSHCNEVAHQLSAKKRKEQRRGQRDAKTAELYELLLEEASEKAKT